MPGIAVADAQAVQPALEVVPQVRRGRRTEALPRPAGRAAGRDRPPGRSGPGRPRRRRATARSRGCGEPDGREPATRRRLGGRAGSHAVRRCRRGAMTCARYPGGRRGYHRAYDHRSNRRRPAARRRPAPGRPVVWGRPLPPTGAGVFVVELAEPRPAAPLELSTDRQVARARAEGLRLDGERPDLASARGRGWRRSGCPRSRSSTSARPGPRSAGGSPRSGRRRWATGGRIPAGTGSTPWRMPPGTRVWWAATPAVEEYEDALLAEFAAGVSDGRAGGAARPGDRCCPGRTCGGRPASARRPA